MYKYFTFLFIFCSCSVGLDNISLDKPFPISDVSDSALVSDFQMLSTDPRFLSYSLAQVQRGELKSTQVYQIGFQVPKGADFILVSACGSGCTSPKIELYDSSGNLAASTSYSGDRAYVALNIGTSDQMFRADISVPSCSLEACSAYWALYAK